MSPPVITGVAALTSAGVRAGDLVAAIESDASPPVDGMIPDFEPKRFVRPRKAIKVMCREIQTAFAASVEALADAGLEDLAEPDREAAVDRSRVATVFGAEMFYGPGEMADALAAAGEDPGMPVSAAAFGPKAMKKISPLWLLKYLPNMPACHIGIALGATGPNNTQTVGEVSGPAALGEAMGYLSRGIVDAAVVTATGNRNDETRRTYRCDLPLRGSLRAFDFDDGVIDPSAGVVGAEAAAGLIVESAASADRRGATPIASVLSHVGRFVPSESMRAGVRDGRLHPRYARGSTAAVRAAAGAALDAAGVEAGSLSGVVGGRCGDPSQDAAETAWTSTLPGSVRVFSPLLNVGHGGSACGGVALVTAAEMVRRGGGIWLVLSHTAEGSATATVLGGQ